MLHGLAAARRVACRVVRLVTVEEAVRENLVADGFFRPVRRLVAFLINGQLEILRATQLQLSRAARLRIVAVFLCVIQKELVPIDAIRLRRERDDPEVFAVLRACLRHGVGRRLPRVVIGIVLVAAFRRHGRLRQQELCIRDIARARRELQRDRRALGDGTPGRALRFVPAVMRDALGVDAAIIGDDVALRRIVIEGHRARLRDLDGLRDGRLPALRDRRRVRASRDIGVGFVEVRQHVVAHRGVLHTRHTRELRQVGVGFHLVAVAVGDVMRLVIIIEGNVFGPLQRQRNIRAIRHAAEAVVLSPAAVDGNLVIIGAGRHIFDGIRIKSVSIIMHARRRVGWRPLRRCAAELLQVADEDDGAFCRLRRLRSSRANLQGKWEWSGERRSKQTERQRYGKHFSAGHHIVVPPFSCISIFIRPPPEGAVSRQADWGSSRM